eukprot:CAMPEP_0182428154 /NCGR_PEP_ID=MMETSP1167-20130531/21062_1 /TAXON_ID=2988 /ORGANISM="Mallomonas Sp, Strain CCMP3275" /LENGTH=774 /DNA_ID=CAMNT_0024610857 /DNA_START=56 /DNA_END=2380 /DNA_ORIENTATION=+
MQTSSFDVKVIFPVLEKASIRPSVNSVCVPKNKNKPNDDIRRGKWTAEEEQFAIKLIEAFNGGLLELPEDEVANGLTLRAFLAQRLCCDPMRITKKFSGDFCLGKRNYHNAEYINQEVLENMRVSLRVLEHKFRLKDMEVKREKMNREELERNKYNPVMDFDHMISSPAIDAMVLKTTPSQISPPSHNPNQLNVTNQNGVAQQQWIPAVSSIEQTVSNPSSVSTTYTNQLSHPQGHSEYGYFYDIKQEPSNGITHHQSHDTCPVSNFDTKYSSHSSGLSGTPAQSQSVSDTITHLTGHSVPPSTDLNMNKLSNNRSHGVYEADFYNGYGNIDIPLDIHPTSQDHESGPGQLPTSLVDIKQEPGSTLSLASDFSFSIDSNFGNFPSSTSLMSGFGFSSSSLNGIMSAFMDDDGIGLGEGVETELTSSPPTAHNTIELSSVAREGDAHYPTTRDMKTSSTGNGTAYGAQSVPGGGAQISNIQGVPNLAGSGDVNLQELSLSLSRSVSIKDAMETYMTSVPVLTNPTSSPSSSKPVAMTVEMEPQSAMTFCSTSSPTLSPTSSGKYDHTEVDNVETDGDHDLFFQSSTSNRPHYIKEELSGAFLSTFCSPSVSMPVALKDHSDPVYASEGRTFSGKVKRNRSVNEWKVVESVALSTPDPIILPTKMRRPNSASCLNLRELGGGIESRIRDLGFQDLPHVFGVRRTVSCCVLFDALFCQGKGLREIKDAQKMLRSKSHNFVIPQYFMTENDHHTPRAHTQSSGTDDFARNEPTAAICI